MKIKNLLLITGFAGVLTVQPLLADDLILPTAQFPYAATYDDFNSYSLPIVNYYLNTDGTTNTIDCSAGDTDSDGIDNCTLAEGDAGYGTTVQNGEPGLVNSQPGELGKDGKYIVIATGTNNAGVNDNSDSATLSDNAYRTDDGGGAGTISFSTVDNDTTMTHSGDPIMGVLDPSYGPGGSYEYGYEVGDDPFTAEFTGDTPDTFDIDLNNLVQFLTNDEGLQEMVIFFNHNELNSDEGDFGAQMLWGWSHVYVTDDNGNNVLDLFLQNTIGTTDSDPNNPESNGVFGDNDFWTEWVLAAGQVCIDPTNVMDPNIGCLGDTSDQIFFNHNLGADNAAYAIISDALNAFLLANSSAAAGDFTVHFDVRLWSEDNGYEQIFIGALNNIETELMPEPLTLALMGIGLAGIGLQRKKLAPH